MKKIIADGLHYSKLNEKIREALSNGEQQVTIEQTCGHRYIGCGLSGDFDIIIRGIPGNDLAAFMNGPSITVHGNGQDGVANTMNAGKIVIHGDAGDVVGHSMRGGKVFVRGNVGYRAGIHMKSYLDHFPVLIVGGFARDYFGEYMAGGLAIILGLDRPDGTPILGKYVGTGMHGGVIYVRGAVEEYQLGKEVGVMQVDKEDKATLKKHLTEYCKEFGLDAKQLLKDKFIKLIPTSHRPYGKTYVY